MTSLVIVCASVVFGASAICPLLVRAVVIPSTVVAE